VEEWSGTPPPKRYAPARTDSISDPPPPPTLFFFFFFFRFSFFLWAQFLRIMMITPWSVSFAGPFQQPIFTQSRQRPMHVGIAARVPLLVTPLKDSSAAIPRAAVWPATMMGNAKNPRADVKRCVGTGG